MDWFEIFVFCFLPTFGSLLIIYVISVIEKGVNCRTMNDVYKSLGRISPPPKHSIKKTIKELPLKSI